MADDLPSTWVFRYQRVAGDAPDPIRPGDWIPFYEGRVTVNPQRPNATFNVTYDYDGGIPDTAVSRPSPPLAGAGLLMLLVGAPWLLLLFACRAPVVLHVQHD
jgi:hypothetical protein